MTKFLPDSSHMLPKVIEYRLQGIPCLIVVTEWEPYLPECRGSTPDGGHPVEGGQGRWHIADTRGRHAPWLERKMKQADRDAIEMKVFLTMEE